MRKVGNIREAASVILVRERDGGPALEVFLLRRHRKAGFMASSFVFPGGVADGRDDGDPRVTAARELFEEAGVLLADPALPAATFSLWRDPVDSGEEDLGALLAEHGSRLALEEMHYFGHWVTPSIEKRRFSARFYVARMPEGQEASPDDRETVDSLWVTPDEGLARAGELRLPPPQVRTFHDIAEAARQGWDALVALCALRDQSRFAILPRMAPRPGGGFWLLLPWDREYASTGQGDASPMPIDHPLAVGPSRFVLGDEGWRNVNAGDEVCGEGENED